MVILFLIFSILVLVQIHVVIITVYSYVQHDALFLSFHNLWPEMFEVFSISFVPSIHILCTSYSKNLFI